MARPLREGRFDRVHRPQFEWVDQHGQQYSSNTYPVKQGTPIVASSTKGGVLPLLPLIGGSGPELRILTAGPIGALLGIPSGSKAINALNLTIPEATTTTYIVGAPQLTLTYSGRARVATSTRSWSTTAPVWCWAITSRRSR